MPPLSVALRIGDPDLRAGVTARLHAMDGAVLVAEEATAELLISDAGPEADDQPVLVLAEGAAAVAALRAGAAGVLSYFAPRAAALLSQGGGGANGAHIRLETGAAMMEPAPAIGNKGAVA